MNVVALPFLTFPALVIFAGFSDLLTMTIPNRVSLLLAGAFLACAALAGLSLTELALHGASGVLVFAAGFALFALGWVGGGDVKLAAATALWIGLERLAEYLLTAAIGGGLLTLALLALRALPLPAFAHGWAWLVRLHDRKSGVPYGIALAAAALVIYPTTPLWRAAF